MWTVNLAAAPRSTFSFRPWRSQDWFRKSRVPAFRPLQRGVHWHYHNGLTRISARSFSEVPACQGCGISASSSEHRSPETSLRAPCPAPYQADASPDHHPHASACLSPIASKTHFFSYAEWLRNQPMTEERKYHSQRGGRS